jgi:hypothetical protein
VANDCDGNAATNSAAATPWMNLDLTFSNLLKSLELEPEA